MLMIAPMLGRPFTIHVDEPVSEPYITLTKSMMEYFGPPVRQRNQQYGIVPGAYTGRVLAIEGDYTQASYFFAGAAISGGSITVTNLAQDSFQGDRAICALLKTMGITVTQKQNAVTVSGMPHQAIRVALGDVPDLVQTIAVLAAICPGKTSITNVSHLRLKESNRLEETARELSSMGIHAKPTDDGIVIVGGNPRGCRIQTHNDHRFAMAFAVLALAARGETTICSGEVVNKSYPTFWTDLASVGARLKLS
jgi:3-phosphoshikimate 1-carboxyvinyltransferase